MKEIIVKENMELFSELDIKPNASGYVGWKFKESKRFASGKLQEDEKGFYFISKKVKYYTELK